MPPRTPLFQRPGGAAPASDTPSAKGAGSDGPPTASQDASANQPSGDNAAVPDDGLEPAVCPNCGCAFDPSTGEVLAPPADQSQPLDQMNAMAAPPGPPAGAIPPGGGGGGGGGDLQSALAQKLGGGQ